MKNYRSGRIGTGFEIVWVGVVAGLLGLMEVGTRYQTHQQMIQTNPEYRTQYLLERKQDKLQAERELIEMMEVRERWFRKGFIR